MDSPTPAPATGEPAGRTRWIRPAIVVGATVAVVLAAVTMSMVSAAREPDSVQTVREFLIAAQRGDPQRALDVAGLTDPPSGEAARFLTPAATSSEWAISSLTEVGRDAPSTGTQAARVQAVIAGPGGHLAESTFQLSRPGHDASWRIERPLVRVRFATGPLWYLDVNGVRAPIRPRRLDLEYALLPGFYRFYAEPPPAVDAQFEDLLLLPGDSVPTVAPQAVSLTGAGVDQVQQAVEAYLDDCVQSTEPDPAGCPFGTDPVTGPRLPEIGYLYDLDRIRWSVVAYPIVAAVPAARHLAITDRRRGVVELTATGRDLDFTGAEERDLGPVDVTVQCVTVSSRLIAGVGEDGTVAVTTPSHLLRGHADPLDTWNTCNRPPLAATG